MKHFLNKLISCALLLGIALMPSQAFAAPDKTQSADKTHAKDYDALLNETDAAKQAERFTAYIQENVKYVGAQSYCGRSGKWMAFVDVYGVYEEGVLQSFLLRQATVQHNARKLPSDTKSASLSINGVNKTIPFKKQSLFLFSDIEIPAPKNEKDLSALTPNALLEKSPLDIRITVETNEKTIAIPVVQDYFSREEDEEQRNPNCQTVLESMASAFVDYATKNNVAAANHVVLRLKSYITNSSNMTRSYSWELYLIESDTLPSASTLLRYDCDTKKVSIAKRALKSYF